MSLGLRIDEKQPGFGLSRSLGDFSLDVNVVLWAEVEGRGYRSSRLRLFSLLLELLPDFRGCP